MLTLLRRLRKALSRSEWFIRWLRLACFEGPPTTGLILIQIDGLSLPQLQRALKRRRMPFLRRLIRRGFRLYPHYPGLPTTTPACQGALFYGVHPAVPAFSFRSRQTGKLVRMYEPEAARAVEERLADCGHPPLLLGSSVYVGNFTGGAQEPHFCPAALGWGGPLRGAPSWALLLFVLLHLPSFVRLATLLLIELGLAVTDCVRGIIQGQDFFKELKFIPTRVGISILLRELSVIGASLDAARGIPVIHVNFLGYDEQAHRRGPDSQFAHWTLKGIDAAIARIWSAARRSRRRRYQVWIYSDHGQERVTPYFNRYGRHLDEAVTELFAELGLPERLQADVGRGIQTQRIRWFGGRFIQRLFPIWNGDEKSNEKQAMLAALGPVAHLYLDRLLDKSLQTQIAKGLVEQAQVPLVLANTAEGVCGWTAEGEFWLPQQAAELFGADHPFIDRLGNDWVRLCQHPEAGDFVLVGWRKGISPLSFAIENGAHAGAGPNETSAFALLPQEAPLLHAQRQYLTTFDLRAAALSLLKLCVTRLS